ncbi:MAG: hypothetical protein AB7K36_22235, partial [Chloroflexota bacterium]
TRQTPVAPLWTAPNVFHTAEEDEVEAEAEAEVEDAEPTQLHEAHEAESEHAEESEVAAAAEPSPEPVAGPGGTVTQTLIFQAVPNFQAALALERSLKAMSEVREVRVADFDERQLTFQVTHELGGQLARVLLTQRGDDLELVDSRTERVEFVFRS